MNGLKKEKILVVEDEAVTGLSIIDKLKSGGYEVVLNEPVFSGEDAVKKAKDEKPDLVLMDIILRESMDGIEAASIIQEKYNIPVVYLTAHTEDQLVKRAKITEPFGYIIKPFTDRELFSNIEIALYKHKAESILKLNHEKLKKTFWDTIEAMARLVEVKSREFFIDQQQIAQFAVAIAEEMKLTKEQVSGIKAAALLYALGLAGVPNELLRRARSFSKEERRLYQLYPQYGYEILKNIEFPWPVAKAVGQHQERLDGSGFPNGINGGAVILEARILGVAHFVKGCLYGDLLNDKISLNATLKQLKEKSGLVFDQAVVEACVKLLRNKNFLARK